MALSSKINYLIASLCKFAVTLLKGALDGVISDISTMKNHVSHTVCQTYFFKCKRFQRQKAGDFTHVVFFLFNLKISATKIIILGIYGVERKDRSPLLFRKLYGA